MNVEIGSEAAQFPEKEYINGIAFAVYANKSNSRAHLLLSFLGCKCSEIWHLCRGRCAVDGVELKIVRMYTLPYIVCSPNTVAFSSIRL